MIREWLRPRLPYVVLAVAMVAGIARVEVIARAADGTARDVEVLVAENEQRRDEDDVGKCVQSNIRTADTRKALKGSLRALIPAGTVLRPDQEEAFARYEASVDVLLEFRDCSPEGIATYLSDPPPDPAVEGTE